MSVNFNLLDPNMPANIAGSVYAGQQQQQQNELAKQQLQQSKMQTEKTGMDIQKMRSDQAALQKMQQAFVANGKSPDLESNFNEMIQSGIPHFVDIGTKGLQTLQAQKQFAAIMGGVPAGPAAPAAPAAAPEVGGNALAPTAPVAAAPVNALAQKPEVASMRLKRDQLLAMGTTQAIAAARALDADIALASKAPVYHNVEGVGLVDPSTGRVVTPSVIKPPAPPSSVAEYERAQQDPKFMRFLQERAAATRAPIQPVAPTVTQIIDPTDPNKMIAIDARRYQGGGAGSPGVLGVSGKEPGAALRQNKVEAGKTQLADDLDNLRASFETLNKMQAIPSTERGVMSNISSATAASGVGQMLGRATGTEAQVERDVINSARQRLVNSIKNATGMSAQQLNSNVELQTMLKSISDPGQSVQAALRIIDDIENAYVKGTGELPKRSQTGKVTSTVIAPADKQALDWANANPKDPRALQIKQRLGQ